MAQLMTRNSSSIGPPDDSLYGNDPPMLQAKTDDTARKMAAIAETMANVMERIFLNRRWGMPGSFRYQGADSSVNVG